MVAHRDLSERAAARIGQVVADKWTLVRLLGVGGTAAVYEARHRNQKRVAVKILHRELSADDTIRERFLREGYVANTVDHPGVVIIDDDDVTADGSAFLVMELLEGETLDAKLAHSIGPLEPEVVVPLVDQLLDTLAEAHFKSVIHRDIKPENVFLTRDGQLKVLDFGIARLLELTATAQKVTQVGTMMGTPAFMAPEQARALWDEVDARTDVWAVGATMFNLLTREFVHEGRTVNEALALAMMKPADSVGSRNPDLPQGLVDVVDRALAFDKADRWQSALEMQDALRQVAADLGIEIAPVVVPRPLASRPSAARGQLALDAPVPLIRTLSPRVGGPTEPPRTPSRVVEVTAPEVAPRDPVLETASALASAVEPRRARSRWPLYVAAGGVVLAVVGAFALSRRGSADAAAVGSASATARPAASSVAEGDAPARASAAATTVTSSAPATGGSTASATSSETAPPASASSTTAAPAPSASAPPASTTAAPPPVTTTTYTPPPPTTVEPLPPPTGDVHIDTSDLPGHEHPPPPPPDGPPPPAPTTDLP